MKTYQFQYLDKSGWKNRPKSEEVDSEKTLILAFCAPVFHDRPELLSELKAYFPQSLIVGCSTSGEIFGDQIFDLSISCVALKFETSRFELAVHDIETSKDSFQAGKALAEKLIQSDLKGAMLFSDGLYANGSALADGFNSVIDSSRVSVAGGLAGDGSQFKQTWIHINGKIEPQKIVAVGLYGADLLISNASRGGWDIFGPERQITRSSENIVYEMDGLPALDLYKEYLGDKAKDLPASGLLFPIQIRSHELDQKRLVRTILSVDEKTKSLTFAGSVPEGCLVQLMRANFNRVIEGAVVAAEDVKARLNQSLDPESAAMPSFCLAVSCVGRRLVLGARTEEEVEGLSAVLGANTAVAGFYSYGELAPSQQGGPCDLHNQSMTLMNINERKPQKAKISA